MIHIPVLMLGGGGHSRVLINELFLLGHTIVGILDPAMAIGDTVSGVKVLGSDSKLSAYQTSEIDLINGIGRLPKNCSRTKLLKERVGSEFNFPAIRSKNAIVPEDTEISEGVQILSGAVIQIGVSLGAHSVINTGSSVDHDCILGENVWVSPGVTVCGGVTLEDNVFLGAGVVVLPGCNIGCDTIVGAGMVVSRSVPRGAFVNSSSTLQDDLATVATDD
jgi:UDP-perosamine 4-acetyltransferase|tara:strand:+ start:451 stop:1110 length:660 start_codon:yes stop_codon:yes gene_type:complete